LRFGQPGAVTAADRVPDIDVIVPRNDLAEVRSYRDSLTDVKLGVGMPSRFIDFRPGDETSYLTHNDKQIAFETRLFDPVRQEVLGVPITTLSPAALVNTYISVREKHRERVAALSELAAEEWQYSGDSEEFAPFKEWMDSWSTNRSVMDKTVDATVRMMERLPAPVRARAFRCALALASIANLR
jgi:hypothetical protein